MLLTFWQNPFEWSHQYGMMQNVQVFGAPCIIAAKHALHFAVTAVAAITAVPIQSFTTQ